MSVVKVLSARQIESIFTIPMAIQAVEQAYLEKYSGQGGTWPMVFHEFDPGHADLDIKSGHLGGADIYGLKVVSWFGANPGKGLPGLLGEIGGVMAGAIPGRTAREDITIFDSTGIALQDLASAASILAAADRENLGTSVEL